MENEIVFRYLSYTCLALSLITIFVLLCKLRKRKDTVVIRWVTITLNLWFILMLKELAYFFGDTWYTPTICYVLMSFDVWIIPVIACTLLSFLRPKGVTIQVAMNMLIPFFALTVLNVIFAGNNTIYIVTQLFSMLFATVYGCITIAKSHRISRYIRTQYSNTQGIDTNWIKFLIISLYIMAVIWFVAVLDFSWVSDALYYLYVTVCIYTITYYATKHKEIDFENFAATSNISMAQSPEIISTEQDKLYSDIARKLDRAMNEDKIYLSNNLTLNELATHIGTNRSYLSRYVNEYKSIPFINYINEFRIREALLIINQGVFELSISELAEQSGFASVSTFRRVFKQSNGCSPSEYIATKKG